MSKYLQAFHGRVSGEFFAELGLRLLVSLRDEYPWLAVPPRCDWFLGISGQSLPILAPLPAIDVLWSDLHLVHEDRSLMSYDPFIGLSAPPELKRS